MVNTMIITLSAIFSFGTVCVDGHGLLTVPSSKNGGTVSTPNESTSHHYTLASYGIIDKAFFDGDHSKTPWKSPGVFDYLMARDLIDGHPETLHPCGCNAGSVTNCAGVVHAREFGETTAGDTLTPPEWARGSSQETAWNAWVNHAGGHLYMLCKKSTFDYCRDAILPANPFDAESGQQDAYLKCVWDCFESGVLEWDEVTADEGGGWSQKVQWRDDRCTYATMEPTTKVGKDGHMWRYTPIPDSLQVTNGGEGKCTWESVVSFSKDEAREKFVASFGTEDVCDWGPDAHAPPDWHVFDKVKVPMDIEDGEYLLSWRWDAYMADQMWTNCADVTIVPPDDSAAATLSSSEECAPTPSTPKPTGSPVKPSITSTTSTAMPPTTDPTCPSGYSGLRPHEDCTKYYRCHDGQVVDNTLIDCHPGTLFDFEFQYCNWSAQVTCETQVQGCYSNNFKDCNIPELQRGDASCHTIWLPDGARNSCIPLWASCTNEGEGRCCEPAVCRHGGELSYAQCVPLSNVMRE